MQIDIVFPALPPALDGIGDYTALLAGTLSSRARVVLHTAQADAAAIDGVDIRRSFRISPPHRIRRIVDAVRRSDPDWLLIQFNQFSYGRWGFNPFLPLSVRRLKKSCPGLKVAVMAHEDFVPPVNWKFAIMRTWQKWQLLSLGRSSDVFFFSIQPWVDQHAPSLGGTPVIHLPVGSNIPCVPASPEAARKRLDIPPGTFVVGVFGTLGASRMLDFIAHGIESIKQSFAEVAVLYVGPDVEIARRHFKESTLITTGPVAPEEVSQALSAMDLHLAPFIDGVSTRRGSFLAGIQHGVPTVSTYGPLTDDILLRENGVSCLLADISDKGAFADLCIRLAGDVRMRREMGTNARAFFNREFRWEVIAERLLTALRENA